MSLGNAFLRMGLATAACALLSACDLGGGNNDGDSGHAGDAASTMDQGDTGSQSDHSSPQDNSTADNSAGDLSLQETSETADPCAPKPTCDYNNGICEPKLDYKSSGCMDDVEACPIDEDCTVSQGPCESDSHCDTWCPEGLDPDCDCSCDSLPSICDSNGEGRGEACACDPDCSGQAEPCALDTYCDVNCWNEAVAETCFDLDCEDFDGGCVVP